MMMFEIEARQSGRTQKVAVGREVIKPDWELLQIQSVFALQSEVNLPSVVEQVGQMLIGSLGFVPVEGDALLTLVTTFPFDALDASKLATVSLTAQVLADAADTLEEAYGGPGLDRF